MSDQFFSDRPTVELLKRLTPGSLKQELPKAVRLWVLLRCLYGDLKDKYILSDPFTYPDWRDNFFTTNHPKGEIKPPVHDPNCPCVLTMAYWLFDSETGLLEEEWRQSLEQHDSVPQNLNKLLQQRLFARTPKTLVSDLKRLVKLGWLRYKQNQYFRVAILPYPTLSSTYNRNSDDEFNFFNNIDIAATAENFSKPIGGNQRFFIYLDYVPHPETQDKIEELQEQLQQIWNEIPIPCVLFDYRSTRLAKLNKSVQCVVYPVCIYYVGRTIYLVAWGRNPIGQVNWYNYRLDKIQGKLISLTWTDKRIPEKLIQRYHENHLFTPDYVEKELDEALGFDFYETASLMLLRFEGDYHQRYIKGTFRHKTFKQVSYQEAVHLIQQQAQSPEEEKLLEIVRSRPPQDAYYTLCYRENDPNVKQRLGAWRDHVEVLYPWKMRQYFAEYIHRLWQLYK
ncbi:hypothetical protein MC7420_4183 [Coleofasciculus chthonoplastes PCC 7420]|uniref:Uncharacterized protein n=1 Tax=Coleofasciculus chthonoplastes PCC 7420 TaxID=118168 RepID=B4VVE4_9CYAN|nr:TIGR03985 family CRISPR-associated protein [Coleofasciculus chthonoplastes]EDX74198.1 hypothetical protein MC7420_4183 [Coleofasciculus chthonoplastes PCC 7420]